jgi:hypothetical protein
MELIMNKITTLLIVFFLNSFVIDGLDQKDTDLKSLFTVDQVRSVLAGCSGEEFGSIPSTKIDSLLFKLAGPLNVWNISSTVNRCFAKYIETKEPMVRPYVELDLNESRCFIVGGLEKIINE